ncbi:hypothetical protein OESDEN_22361 [Oesophagostomum dentatum]|uniref:Helitron helicase-like domain-containing protein n=1 Tax=Oesophagostomum dentatum TaxID=61180 RepID=A0A0B1RZB1_OESDE|nr:hypothetical protein OESDEN_22361 [Oesophagostomum dentatum]
MISRRQPAVFAQIFIFDTEAAANELAGRPVNRDFFSVLQGNNIIVQSYRMMDEEEEVRKKSDRGGKIDQRLPVKMVFETRALDGRRRYNVATSNGIAVVYKGDDKQIEGKRRLDYDPMCDPLTYPILFPRGEMGWHPGMAKQRVESCRRSNLTQREYYAYLLQIRDSVFNPILQAEKLIHQFVVDSWVKMEQNLRQNR